TYLVTGSGLLPDIKWILILLLVAPSISMISITLTVRVSAKAQSVEDAQQGAVFLLMPVLLLIIGQFTGVLLVSAWILLALGAVCALLAALLLKRAIGRFQYEALLKS
ncbi:MAG: ABC transporter permease, partial [Lachnospiraceae bacterium]|nr:ABC transporter permease [Lachnospiraceae bacterium]